MLGNVLPCQRAAVNDDERFVTSGAQTRANGTPSGSARQLGD